VAFARTSGRRGAVLPEMNAHAYLMLVAAGSAAVGLWITVRLERLTPKTGRGAGVCVLAAWLVPGVMRSLFATALLHLPVGLAILVTIFPLLVVTFALTAWALRYFVGLLGHTAR
jgi:hypothetical protein